MSEMAAVDFGQYAHSNQPVHHVLYLFSVAGRRDRTQFWVHRVLNELYTKDTYAGDEDTGSMAAWYVLGALGLFSHCPGKTEWTLGAPLFAEASIARPGGTILRIQAKRKSSGRLPRQGDPQRHGCRGSLHPPCGHCEWRPHRLYGLSRVRLFINGQVIPEQVPATPS